MWMLKPASCFQHGRPRALQCQLQRVSCADTFMMRAQLVGHGSTNYRALTAWALQAEVVWLLHKQQLAVLCCEAAYIEALHTACHNSCWVSPAAV